MTVEAAEGRLAAFRALFGPKGFGRLITAQSLSQTADGLYQVALASLLVFNVSAAKTPGQVTKLLAVTLVPFSLVGPFTGPFIDRFSRRSILVGTSLARVALTLLLIPAIGWSEPVMLGLVVANMSINRFFHSTKGAVLPTTVEPGQYLLANSISSTAGMVLGATGAVIGGPLADMFGPRPVILVAAVCILGTAGLAATLRLPPGERRGLTGIVAELGDAWRDTADGVRVLRRHPRAIYAVSAIWSIRALLGFVLLAALVVVRARFDVRATGFSALLGAVAIGSFVGAVTVPIAARRFGRAGVAPLAFAIAGVSVLLGGSVLVWPTLLASVFAGGYSMATTKIASDTLIQRSIPDHFRGRAFSVYDIGYNCAFVVAGLIPTALRPFLSESGLVLVAGGLYLVGAVGFAAWKRRLPGAIEVRSYAGGRDDEVPREVVWDGTTVAVADVERSWVEERAGGERVRCFRLRLDDGRRLEVSSGEEWQLDRLLPELPVG